MRKEWSIFLAALMFLTRLPVPRHIDHGEELLQQSPRYFPLIGWIVALLSFVTLFVFYKYVGEDIAILASIIAGILTTGAFHEDGFADTCDAFGGGWTKEKILAIMKDSRLGTYGVAGLVMMLAAKFLLLKELLAHLKFTALNEWELYSTIGLVMISAHGTSRLMCLLAVQRYDYVTSADGSKSKPLASKKLSPFALMIALFFAVVPLSFLSWHYFFIMFPLVLTAVLMCRYFKKWIGGYTGDCLGAIQQVSEIVFYLSVLMLWKYIL